MCNAIFRHIFDLTFSDRLEQGLRISRIIKILIYALRQNGINRIYRYYQNKTFKSVMDTKRLNFWQTIVGTGLELKCVCRSKVSFNKCQRICESNDCLWFIYWVPSLFECTVISLQTGWTEQQSDARFVRNRHKYFSLSVCNMEILK